MKPHTPVARDRILVVRRDNIGDLVCTTPLISALRRRYPTSWLGAWVNSYNAPVLAGNTDLDEVLTYTKLKHLQKGAGALGAIGRRISDLVRLRRKRLDLVVLATPDFSPRLLRLARLLAPKEIVGFCDRSRAARSLHRAVPIESVSGRHEVQRVYALAPLLGLDPEPPPLRVVPAMSEVQKASVAFGAGSRKIAVHISARRPFQRWPAESFSTLIGRICREHDARILLLWSPGASDDPRHPGDDEKAREILGRTASFGTVGYPTHRLDELIGALAASDALICSDGGAMHIAAALGKPIVCFFGDSPVERWHPWGVPHRVLRPATRNVSDISIDETVAALRSLVK